MENILKYLDKIENDTLPQVELNCYEVSNN